MDLIDLTSDNDVSDEDLSPSFSATPISPAIGCVPEDKIDLIKIKHILQQHQCRVITSVDDEDVQRTHVRCSHIYADSFMQFSKELFNVSRC